nr:uncharacterized protein LOC111838967 isoform X1 [Paramormyrops kingsleyae]
MLMGSCIRTGIPPPGSTNPKSDQQQGHQVHRSTVIGLFSSKESELEYRDEVERLSEWCRVDNLLLNTTKTKELVIDFRKNKIDIQPLIIARAFLDRVAAEMEEQDSSDADALLLQLVLQLQKLCLKKNEMQQQIHIYQEKNAEKREQMDRTKQSTEKLEKELCHGQKLVMHYKDSIKSLRGTNSLLLQFRCALQEELQNREENYTQDMRMYDTRTETYTKVFEQHKTQYCQSLPALKLLKMQEEKEQIELRKPALEEKIASKERELQTLHGCIPFSPLSNTASENGNEEQTSPQKSAEQAEKTLEKNQREGSGNCFVLKGIEIVGKTGRSSEEDDVRKIRRNYKEEFTGNEVVAPPSTMSPNSNLMETGGLQGCEEVQIEDVKTGAGEMGKQVAREQAAHTAEEGEQRDSYLRTPRMKAVSSTPTFSLSGNPSQSPHGEASVSPGFMFAAHSVPDTPSFSGFDCTFHVESTEEDIPFYFSSSCFTDKKLSACKSTGFLFEQVGSRSEDEHDFPFSSGSPSQGAASPALGRMEDNIPFSFTFGKFQ